MVPIIKPSFSLLLLRLSCVAVLMRGDHVKGQQFLDCATITPCSCASKKGVIDLSPLDSRDPQRPRFRDIKSEDNYLYSFNPCTGFSEGEDGDCKNVAICQIRSYYYSLGSQSSATFVNDKHTGLELRTQAQGSDGVWRTAHMQLVCDPYRSEPTLHIMGEDSGTIGNYRMKLISKHCCPVNLTTPTNPTTPGHARTTQRPRVTPSPGLWTTVIIVVAVVCATALIIACLCVAFRRPSVVLMFGKEEAKQQLLSVNQPKYYLG